MIIMVYIVLYVVSCELCCVVLFCVVLGFCPWNEMYYDRSNKELLSIYLVLCVVLFCLSIILVSFVQIAFIRINHLPYTLSLLRFSFIFFLFNSCYPCYPCFCNISIHIYNDHRHTKN